MARRSKAQDAEDEQEFILLRGGPVYRVHEPEQEPMMEFKRTDPDEADDGWTEPEESKEPKRGLFGRKKAKGVEPGAGDGWEDVPTEERAPRDDAQPRGPHTYRPAHMAPMRDIHFEIDHLEAIKAGHVPRGTPGYRTDIKAQERTVYETPRGRVTEADAMDGGKELYTQGATYDSRRKFRSEMVDSIIAGVELEEELVVQEEVTEMVPRKVTKQVTDTEGWEPEQLEEVQEVQEAPKATPAKAPRAKPKAPERDYQPQCAAVTAAGDQCRNSARGGSKYCGAHKGFRPVSAEVAAAAKDTKPVVQKAEDTAPAARAAAKAKKAAKPKAPAKTPKPYYDYTGDVHPVIEVEGIGPTYAKKLEAIGIKTTARLCYETAASIGRRIGAPAKTVHTWQSMAELAKVNGIGPQYAEALARAGIQGIHDLKDKDADAIADKVNKYIDGLKSNIIGQRITAKRVETWKTNAASMRRVRQKTPEE